LKAVKNLVNFLDQVSAFARHWMTLAKLRPRRWVWSERAGRYHNWCICSSVDKSKADHGRASRCSVHGSLRRSNCWRRLGYADLSK